MQTMADTSSASADARRCNVTSDCLCTACACRDCAKRFRRSVALSCQLALQIGNMPVRMICLRSSHEALALDLRCNCGSPQQLAVDSKVVSRLICFASDSLIIVDSAYVREPLPARWAKLLQAENDGMVCGTRGAYVLVAAWIK